MKDFHMVRYNSDNLLLWIVAGFAFGEDVIPRALNMKLEGYWCRCVIYFSSTEYYLYVQISNKYQKHIAYKFLCYRDKYDNNLDTNMVSKTYK